MSDFKVMKRYSKLQEWQELSAAESDYYNHHELYRIDSTNSSIFISAGFSNQTDTIYLKSVSNGYSTIELDFVEITKYVTFYIFFKKQGRSLNSLIVPRLPGLKF